MIEIMLAFFITNLTNSSLPYNTTFNPNPLYLPNIITQNIPWFFPLITILAFIITDYVLTVKNAATRTMLLGTLLAYTIVAYVEVAGGLTSSAYYFVFVFGFLLMLFITVLFSQEQA
ncbi:MAG: hypothetical protein QXV17_06725 [Candidatus Micrarchaeaceae archaeon]